MVNFIFTVPFSVVEIYRTIWGILLPRIFRSVSLDVVTSGLDVSEKPSASVFVCRWHYVLQYGTPDLEIIPNNCLFLKYS